MTLSVIDGRSLAVPLLLITPKIIIIILIIESTSDAVPKVSPHRKKININKITHRGEHTVEATVVAAVVVVGRSAPMVMVVDPLAHERTMADPGTPEHLLGRGGEEEGQPARHASALSPTRPSTARATT
uniref:Uncharacterized protein n=1 Tax=Oryza rufipogon TaxID=4529 RepID=A0A0E0NW85_ORYRU